MTNSNKEYLVTTDVNNRSKIIERNKIVTDIFKDQIILELSRLCIVNYSRRDIPFVLANKKVTLVVSFSAPTLVNLSNEDKEKEVFNKWKDYFKLCESGIYPDLLKLVEDKIVKEFSDYCEPTAVKKFLIENYPEATTIELYSAYSDQHPLTIGIKDI